MPGLIYVDYIVTWRRTDADGGNCYCCNDPCYLEQWEAFYRVNGGEEKKLPIRLCGSCADVCEVKDNDATTTDQDTCGED